MARAARRESRRRALAAWRKELVGCCSESPVNDSAMTRTAVWRHRYLLTYQTDTNNQLIF
jgi:hypothetical protein